LEEARKVMVNSCIFKSIASILSATGLLLLIHIWILPVFFGGYNGKDKRN